MVLGIYCTWCIQYSVYADIGVCCTWCVVYSELTLNHVMER